MQAQLTRDDMESAFDLLGKMALGRGLSIEITVFGGSCLVLATDVRNASADVDAVFRGHEKEIYAMLRTVARERRLPVDWLNQGVKRLAPPVGNPEPTLIPFGHYPRGLAALTAVAGLRVLLPTPEYMLAMKLLANRLSDEEGRTETDIADAVALMKITGLTSRQQLVALLKECNPNIPGVAMPLLSARMAAKVDAVIDAYEGTDKDVIPAWNAGRGPAIRS